MPYIHQDRRDQLDHEIFALQSSMTLLNQHMGPLVAGDLNYIVYSLALQYIKIKGSGYNNISDAIKALTGAAHEVERRILDPYEDSVIEKNGDIHV